MVRVHATRKGIVLLSMTRLAAHCAKRAVRCCATAGSRDWQL